MEADRRIRDADIDDWLAALHDADTGDWSDLHRQGAHMLLQAMAASEASYTGMDLYRAFASSDARATLQENVRMDFHTLDAVDPATWRDLSRSAASLTGVSSGRFAEGTRTEESDT